MRHLESPYYNCGIRHCICYLCRGGVIGSIPLDTHVADILDFFKSATGAVFPSRLNFSQSSHILSSSPYKPEADYRTICSSSPLSDLLWIVVFVQDMIHYTLLKHFPVSSLLVVIELYNTVWWMPLSSSRYISMHWRWTYGNLTKSRLLLDHIYLLLWPIAFSNSCTWCWTRV